MFYIEFFFSSVVHELEVNLIFFFSFHYRKRRSLTHNIGSASALPIMKYIVREVHSVRERDTERERKTEVTSPMSR